MYRAGRGPAAACTPTVLPVGKNGKTLKKKCGLARRSCDDK
jgi:hypothetical protein